MTIIRAVTEYLAVASFMVMQAARSAGMVAENVFSTVIAASLISILFNVFIVRGTFAWLGKSTSDHVLTTKKNEVLVPAIQ